MPVEPHVAEPQLNATPLIDVLLVLLVMLIFTLPVMTHGVKLNLPQGPPRGSISLPESMVVGIDFDGALTWNGRRVESIEALEARLRAVHEMVPMPRVAISADTRSRYEPVAQVLAATQRAQLRDVRIIDLPDR
jgi:biopolymer transport protein ExbD